MIKHLTLKNFRKHTDLSLDFTSGLNVLRGANESGKSTITEGLLYALFGSKALRTTLAECATWGQKESSLKVELVIHVDGKDVTFTRSKGSAEARCGDVLVTGQAEVTAYASELLGADAKTASMLMMASQSGLRGALDDGPAAVSGLMARLANFELVDQIIEAAQAKLALGSDEPVKQKLAVVVADLDALVVPDPEDWKPLESRRAGLTASIQTLEAQIASELEPAWQAALAELNKGSAHNLARAKLEADLTALAERRYEVAQRLERAQVAAARVPEAQIAAAQADVEANRNLQALQEAHEKVRTLPTYPAAFWEGSKADLEDEVEAQRKLQNIQQGLAQAALAEAKALRRALIKGGKCPTCGHDAGHDDHVREHNAKIEASAAAQEKAAQHHSAQADEAGRQVSALVAIKKLGVTFEAAIPTGPAMKLVSVDLTVHPPRVTWTGGIPQASDLKQATLRLKALQEKDAAALKAEGEAKVQAQYLKEIEASINEVDRKLEVTPLLNLTEPREAHDKAYEAYTRALTMASDLKSDLGDVNAEIDAAVNAYRTAVSKRDLLLERKAEYESDLKRLGFNNALLKKLRTLKPQITDSLWSLVLSAVSNFFTTMRGENSVVTKDAQGFKVNGQSVESLSGSTLDALAIAIRVALTKTFIPHASFVVLDEPAHGADDQRTSNILGFLSSAGFVQTILATHDPLSQDVANAVIEVGV